MKTLRKFFLIASIVAIGISILSIDNSFNDTPSPHKITRPESTENSLPIKFATPPVEGAINTSNTPNQAKESSTDIVFESHMTMDLCDYPEISKRTTTSAIIEDYKIRHGSSNSIARTTEQLLKNLCKSKEYHLTAAKQPGKLDAFNLLIEESKSFQESVAFVNLFSQGETHDLDQSETEAFVKNKLSNIDSFYEFLETTSLLNDTPAITIALKNNGYPQGLQKDIADYASMVAACRIFGGCSPNSTFSVSLCFLVCEKPMSAEEFARSSIPERNREEFERAVDAIVSLRKKRPH